jgi:hypothetical protein
MQIIAHRINTLEELKKVPESYGVEIDLRDEKKELILQHDPFSDGELFENFLKAYRHKTLILNIKSERIENKVTELIKKYNVTDYFFLDCSFPMIHLLSKNGEKNIALRYSEYEGLDTIENLKGKVKWIWVDCFSRLIIDKEKSELLKSWGYKICLVSPELQGRQDDVIPYKEQIKANNIHLDAVCTKMYNTALWQAFS